MKYLVVLVCVAAVSALTDVPSTKKDYLPPTTTPTPISSSTEKPIISTLGQNSFASFHSSLFPSISTYSSYGALPVSSLTSFETPLSVGPTFAPVTATPFFAATAAPFISGTAAPLTSTSFLSAPSSFAYDSTYDTSLLGSHYSLPSSTYYTSGLDSGLTSGGLTSGLTSGLTTGFSGFPQYSGYYSGFPQYSGYYSGFDSAYGGLSGFDSSLFSGLNGASSTLGGASSTLGASNILGANSNTDAAVVIDAKKLTQTPIKPEQPISTPAPAPQAPASVKPLENFKPADFKPTENSKPTETAPEAPLPPNASFFTNNFAESIKSVGSPASYNEIDGYDHKN